MSAGAAWPHAGMDRMVGGNIDGDGVGVRNVERKV